MNKELLMRDNLSDTGSVPSIGSMYNSPDLIVHEQIEDPYSFFIESYNKDVNQPLDIHSHVNLIYVRVKNLSNVPKIAYIHLYAANASLFLNTSEWITNKLKTAEGVDYVQTDVIQPGEIGVGKVPFVFNALSDHNYCHIGYVLDSPNEPDIPSDFKDYEEYSTWLHGNTNICMRNFTLIDGPRYYLENSCGYSNPKNQDISGIFEFQLGGKFPANTEIVFISKQLGIEKKIVLEKDITQYSDVIKAVIPSNSIGVVILKVSLPLGYEGEKGAYAALLFYVIGNGKKLLHPKNQELSVINISPMFKEQYGSLIKVGQCTVAFNNN